MAWSRAFQKCIIFYFLDKFFFANIFNISLDFGIKNSIFANLQIFLQILKIEHTSFPMMYHLSYLDIKHGIFQVPSRDRVNSMHQVIEFCLEAEKRRFLPHCFSNKD